MTSRDAMGRYNRKRSLALACWPPSHRLRHNIFPEKKKLLSELLPIHKDVDCEFRKNLIFFSRYKLLLFNVKTSLPQRKGLSDFRWCVSVIFFFETWKKIPWFPWFLTEMLQRFFVCLHAPIIMEMQYCGVMVGQCGHKHISRVSSWCWPRLTQWFHKNALFGQFH